MIADFTEYAGGRDVFARWGGSQSDPHALWLNTRIAPQRLLLLTIVTGIELRQKGGEQACSSRNRRRHTAANTAGGSARREEREKEREGEGGRERERERSFSDNHKVTEGR